MIAIILSFGGNLFSLRSDDIINTIVFSIKLLEWMPYSPRLTIFGSRRARAIHFEGEKFVDG